MISMSAISRFCYLQYFSLVMVIKLASDWLFGLKLSNDKIRDLFKVKLNTIRSGTKKKKEREREKREKKRE